MTSLPALAWLAALGMALARADVPTADPLTVVVVVAGLAALAGRHTFTAATALLAAASSPGSVRLDEHGLGHPSSRALDPSARATTQRLSVIRT